MNPNLTNPEIVTRIAELREQDARTNRPYWQEPATEAAAISVPARAAKPKLGKSRSAAFFTKLFAFDSH